MLSRMKITFMFCLYVFIIVAGAIESNPPLSSVWKQDGCESPSSEMKKFLVSCRHKGVHKYTGFLISENEILTSVNFITDFLTKRKLPDFMDYSVVVGIDKNSSKESKPIGIEEVRCHRKFNSYNPSLSHYVGLVMLVENVVSDSVGLIDISAQPLESLAQTYLLGFKYLTDVESDNPIGFKSIGVVIRPKIHCQIQPSESLVCVSIETPDNILDEMDIGAPLIQEGVAIGMLLKIISRELAICMNLYRTYNEISEMRSERLKKPIDRIPRRRARRDQDVHTSVRRKRKYFEEE